MMGRLTTIGLLMMLLVVTVTATYRYCEADSPSISTYTALHNATLTQVLLFTRHGDRSPCNPLPVENSTWNCDVLVEQQAGNVKTEVWRDDQVSWDGNCAVGQLTKIGFDQHYKLGKNLKELYFTDEEWFDRMLFRSTEVPRALQSAQGFLSGLLEETSDMIVPIYTLGSSVDILQPNTGLCPRLGVLMNEVTESAEWQKHLVDYKFLQENLGDLFGTRGMQAWEESFDHYADNMHSRLCHEMGLPCSIKGCVTEDEAGQVFDAGSWEFNFKYTGYKSTEIARLAAGPLFEAALTMMKDGKFKFGMFSGHDGTVGALLGGLGLEDWEWPPYATNIVWELWEKEDKSSVVRVLYNGEPQNLQFCSAEVCSFKEFEIYLRNTLISEDYEADCGIKNLDFESTA